MDLRALGLVIICLALGQCTNKKSTNTETTDSDTTITKSTNIEPAEQEDYTTFISKFNADTVFQKSRIKYDLSKYYDKYYDMSLSTIDTSEFKITTRLSDKVIVRVTNRKDTTYWIQYFFTKEVGSWYLTDYWDNYNN